ncbi:MAG: DIP1984 family protein [Acidobacteria bacterium]|nr:DIP1984 family protein [Acidobacteriota bacterium]
MKLAEALILRADCQKRLEQLKARVIRNAKVQEGDQPAEEPQALLAEAERVSRELADLVKRVNRTNSATAFGDGLSLSDALAERDALGLRFRLYSELAQAASISQDRYSRSEVKYVSAVSVADAQKRADELAREYRTLDARIQELNWQVDLSE